MATQIHVDGAHPGAVINKNIYGHFAEHLGRCIYGGVFVGKDSNIPNVNGMRKDVVDALKKLQVPVLRWPGGCFADEYHWQDGIGPKENRKRMVNTNWGGVVEDNSFGTHEFLELCRQIGCEPYINANVGSGSVREMAEWVEYLNSDGDSSVVKTRWANGQKDAWGVKYFGVGNESWGCGGNMRPEFYADLYRRFQTYCRDYGDNKLYRIACGPSEDDLEWTEVLMKRAGRYFDALTLHSYTVPSGEWKDKGSATEFDEERYYATLSQANKMEARVAAHIAVIDRYEREMNKELTKPHHVDLLVDEWGCWHNVEPGTNEGFLYQQNTMRDAMVAALTLNIFNRHADRIAMANIAQMVNVLQSVILTDGEDMVLTPTYHVYDLYRAHMNAQLLDCAVFTGSVPGGVKQVSASASVKDGIITVTAANLHATESARLELTVDGALVREVSGRVLHGDMHAKNDFENQNAVDIRPLTGIDRTANGCTVELPPCAVAEITIQG